MCVVTTVVPLIINCSSKNNSFSSSVFNGEYFAFLLHSFFLFTFFFKLCFRIAYAFFPFFLGPFRVCSDDRCACDNKLFF